MRDLETAFNEDIELPFYTKEYENSITYLQYIHNVLLKEDLTSTLQWDDATFQTLGNLYEHSKQAVEDIENEIKEITKKIEFKDQKIRMYTTSLNNLKNEGKTITTQMATIKNDISDESLNPPKAPDYWDRVLSEPNPGFFNSFVKLFFSKESIQASEQLCLDYDNGSEKMQKMQNKLQELKKRKDNLPTAIDDTNEAINRLQKDTSLEKGELTSKNDTLRTIKNFPGEIKKEIYILMDATTATEKKEVDSFLDKDLDIEEEFIYSNPFRF